MLIWDAGTEVVGEQGDYYDLLFTYREGDEASYFVSDEPEGRAADVGPSGAGEGKESPMVPSSRGMVAKPVASATVEGEQSAATITEALRTDELLNESASGDLAETGASPVTAGVSTTEPVEVSTTVEGAPKDIAEETIKSGAMTTVASTPFDNAIVTCKRLLLFCLPLT